MSATTENFTTLGIAANQRSIRRATLPGTSAGSEQGHHTSQGVDDIASLRTLQTRARLALARVKRRIVAAPWAAADQRSL